MTDEKRPIARSATSMDKLPDEPPVVARLVIEIRSDGSRTVARGALEDSTQGVRVGLEARGNTPMELAASLTRSMLDLPGIRTLQSLRRRVRALLPGRKGK